jgi:hypothetical protein
MKKSYDGHAMHREFAVKDLGRPRRCEEKI